MTWFSQGRGESITQVRLTVAKWVGATVGAASRMSGRGQGIVLAGRTINALAPNALAQLSAGRSTVLVSGTNGKTTTTAMIVASLGGAVATNNSGANVPAGIVEAYARSACARAVIEVDELYVPVIGSSTLPTIFVALNLSRDHMDRVHEVGLIAQRWSDFLDDWDTHVIANASDPNIVAAVGAHSVTWVDPGRDLVKDAAHNLIRHVTNCQRCPLEPAQCVFCRRFQLDIFPAECGPQGET